MDRLPTSIGWRWHGASSLQRKGRDGHATEGLPLGPATSSWGGRRVDSYADAEGALRRPVLLHRALCGSLERFLGLLLERWEGRLPPWLAPEPARVLPVGGAHADWAAHVAAVLRARGVEAHVDSRDKRLGRKVAEAHAGAVPFVLIVGERECGAREVMVREGRREVPLALDEAVDRISAACEPPL